MVITVFNIYLFLSSIFYICDATPLSNINSPDSPDIESRIFGFFKKPTYYYEAPGPQKNFLLIQKGSTTTTTTSAPSPATTVDPAVVREALCNSFGGKIVNSTRCYQYFEESLDYDASVNSCISKSGNLWVPDIFDEELSFILFQQFPEVYDSFSVWIGIRKEDDSFVSETGQIFDNHPSLRPYLTISESDYYYGFGLCTLLDLNGNLYNLYATFCPSTHSYVCEYDVTL
ncbi:UNVERIFIED_CONTAM: hypothetical protein RMT77_018353 [Armadillidium vulgare]